MRPPRSALYVPAANPRALAKARDLAADALILDLEDSVAPEAKAQARAAAVGAVRQGFPAKAVIVRVNAFGSIDGEADLYALTPLRPDALLFPKVQDRAEAAAITAAVAPTPAWVMIETPRAVIESPGIAGAGVQALVAGWNDLALALGLSVSPDRRELWSPMSALVLAARASGALALDGVPLALRDSGRTHAEAEQARAFGFDGKTLVHPDQIAPTHEGFAPTPDEQEAAHALLAAWEARPAQAGVIQHAGRLVEALHAEAARRLLARTAPPC